MFYEVTMSDFIVLVKQVPDVSQISDNAFNPETGTLMRNKLASVINELDTNALAVAHHMRTLQNNNGRIIAVTMGPPASAEVLRYCLARGADKALLITDRAFGGADTYATANTIAAALAKLAKEVLATDDYYIVSGMQSVDGDTAQVPPQIAAHLNFPCISYVTDVTANNGSFEFTRIVTGGSEVVRSKSQPALITVAKFPHLLYPAFSAARRAAKADLLQWGMADINPTSCGLAGSKTQVIKVFAPPKSQRKAIKVDSIPDLAAVIAQNARSASAAVAAEPAPHAHCTTAPPKLNLTLGSKDFWVVAELTQGKITEVTYELIAKARRLAGPVEATVSAVLCSPTDKTDADQLIHAGADRVHVIIDPLLSSDDPAPHTKAIAQLVSQHWPQIVFFAATPFGRTVAPMISYGLHCGLTADCTAFDIVAQDDSCILMQTRPALGGNVMATICSKNCKSQMATARPGVFKRLAADSSRKGEITVYKPTLTPADLSLDILKTEVGSASSKFAQKQIIISGGKGLKNKENYELLTQTLADAIEKSLGVKPEIGASRSAVEHGFAPRSSQVGQTGTSVAPKIYIALGISGAIQHVIGITNADLIIAVNNDPSAPIFKASDYYYTGHAEEVVPQLAKELEKLKNV